MIGVDRDDRTGAFVASGADFVVQDLGECLSRPADDDRPVLAGPREHRLVAAAMRLLAASAEYPVEPMRLVEREFNPDYAPQTETLFATANGYLGIRGTPEEGNPVHQSGTLLNGFYETWPIVYAEEAYGFAKVGQTILNVTDGTLIRLYQDEDPIDSTTAEVEHYERALDMQQGTLDRSIVYRLPSGDRFRLRTRRFVSIDHRHLAAIRYEVTALDNDTTVTIASELKTHHGEDAGEALDPRRGRGFDEGVLETLDRHIDDARVVMALGTANSKLTMACGMDHAWDDERITGVDTVANHDEARTLFRADLTAGQPARPHEVARLPPRRRARRGADVPHERHARRSDVDDVRRRARDASLPREGVLGAVGRGDRGRAAAPTGDALQPLQRHAGHGAARGARAAGEGSHRPGLRGSLLLGHRGVRRPVPRAHPRPGWPAACCCSATACSTPRGSARPRSARRGRCSRGEPSAGRRRRRTTRRARRSTTSTPTSRTPSTCTSRRQATRSSCTATAWRSSWRRRASGPISGYFSSRHDGRFVINGVTGPDEYSTVVDNNLYTNLMAANNLRLAADTVEEVRDDSVSEYRQLCERTGVTDDELDDWRRAADHIYIAYDEVEGVHLQDDAFLERKVWDFENTPSDQYPLLLHFHPLVIYRHQVIKQADVVLATVLLPEKFTEDERRRIFEYYDPLTTGDSSLSESMQSIAAANIGAYRAAEEYMVDAASVDIADTAGNVRDGIHIASAGGTWMAFVYGFAGLKYEGDRIRFTPHLPSRVRGMRFRLQHRGSVVEIEMHRSHTNYALVSGPEITIGHHDEDVVLRADEPVVIDELLGRGLTDRRTQRLRAGRRRGRLRDERRDLRLVRAAHPGLHRAARPVPGRAGVAAVRVRRRRSGGQRCVGPAAAAPQRGPAVGRRRDRRRSRARVRCASLSTVGLVAVLLFVAGCGDGVQDVSMNAAGVTAQRRRARPVMQRLHASWSIGFLGGAIVGAVAAGVGVPITVHVPAATLAAALVAVVFVRWFPPPEPVRLRSRPRMRLSALPWLLGLGTALSAFMEIVPTDWSSLYLREVRGVAAGPRHRRSDRRDDRDGRRPARGRSPDRAVGHASRARHRVAVRQRRAGRRPGHRYLRRRRGRVRDPRSGRGVPLPGHVLDRRRPRDGPGGCARHRVDVRPRRVPAGPARHRLDRGAVRAPAGGADPRHRGAARRAHRPGGHTEPARDLTGAVDARSISSTGRRTCRSVESPVSIDAAIEYGGCDLPPLRRHI